MVYKHILMVAALAAGFLGVARADVISLYGDKDCFGLGGVCADGSGFTTTLGGVQFQDYRSASEVASNSDTDIWKHQNPSVSMAFHYALVGTPLSATFTTRIAGIANSGQGPDNVTFDGVLLGQIPKNGSSNSDEEVLTYSFAVPIGLLTGNDNIAISVYGLDAFIIDYGELSVQTTATPEPASVWILGAGLAGVFAMGRRKAVLR